MHQTLPPTATLNLFIAQWSQASRICSPAPSFIQPNHLPHCSMAAIHLILTPRESQLTPGCPHSPTHGQQAVTDHHTSDCWKLTGNPTTPYVSPLFDFSHRSVMHTKNFHSRAAGWEWIPTSIGASLLSKDSAATGPNSAPPEQWYLINRCLYLSILILGVSASFFFFSSCFILFCFLTLVSLSTASCHPRAFFVWTQKSMWL